MDDDWDIVYYFDYTVDFPDYYVAAIDYDLKTVLLANRQQVKTFTLTDTYGTVFFCFLPYRTVLF
jgi:hypothetical protein